MRILSAIYSMKAYAYNMRLKKFQISVSHKSWVPTEPAFIAKCGGIIKILQQGCFYELSWQKCI